MGKLNCCITSIGTTVNKNIKRNVHEFRNKILRLSVLSCQAVYIIFPKAFAQGIAYFF